MKLSVDGRSDHGREQLGEEMTTNLFFQEQKVSDDDEFEASDGGKLAGIPPMVASLRCSSSTRNI